MKRLLFPLAAVLAFGAACGGTNDTDDTTRDESGTIVESGDLGVFAIKVGDCFDEVDYSSQVDEVSGLACDGEHIYEVYHAFDIAGDTFPGDESVVTSAQDGCLAAFEGFVGMDYNESVLDISYLYPTEDSWNLGDDREVLCMVYNLDGTPRVGSAAGAGV